MLNAIDFSALEAFHKRPRGEQPNREQPKGVEPKGVEQQPKEEKAKEENVKPIKQPSPKRQKLFDFNLPEFKEAKESKDNFIQPLVDYCTTISVDFHKDSVTKVLMSHIQKFNDDEDYPVCMVLLSGPSGSGKTFCVKRACKEAGFRLLDMDESVHSKIDPKKHTYVADVEKQAMEVLTSKPGMGAAKKRICVALFESIDDIQASDRKTIWKSIKSVNTRTKTTAAKKTTPKAKKPKKTSIKKGVYHNFIILTACDRYKQTIRDIRMSTENIQLADINANEKMYLAEQCYKYLTGRNMERPVYSTLYKMCGENVSSVLQKVELLALDPSITITHGMDKTSMDLFKSCQALLVPNDSMTLEDYDLTWELGGEKVFGALFNSYPSFVQQVSSIPNRPIPKDERMGYSLGMMQTAHIADLISWDDSVEYGSKHMSLTALKTGFKETMSGVFSKSRGKIDVYAQHMNIPKRTCFAKCCMSRSDEEKLRFVATINQIHTLKKVANCKYEPLQKYDMADYVGTHYVRGEKDDFQKFLTGASAADKQDCMKLLSHWANKCM